MRRVTYEGVVKKVVKKNGQTTEVALDADGKPLEN